MEKAGTNGSRGRAVFCSDRTTDRHNIVRFTSQPPGTNTGPGFAASGDGPVTDTDHVLQAALSPETADTELSCTDAGIRIVSVGLGKRVDNC